MKIKFRAYAYDFGMVVGYYVVHHITNFDHVSGRILGYGISYTIFNDTRKDVPYWYSIDPETLELWDGEKWVACPQKAEKQPIDKEKLLEELNNES